MALHEKLTSLAKDAATKANSLAKDAASKANTAIENGKLSLKINNEEKKIDEFTLNIGELILDQLKGLDLCAAVGAVVGVLRQGHAAAFADGGAVVLAYF